MVADSDEEEGEIDAVAYKKGQTSRKRSPQPISTKKQRVTVPPLSEEEEEDSDEVGIKSFSRRLTKYQKSPTNKKAKRKTTDDDDDFIVPDDDDEVDDVDEENHRSSSRASSRASGSSHLSAYAHSSAASEAESDAPEGPVNKPKTSARPALKKDHSSKGGNSFLTAAEQRAQQQKADKKSNEDAFSFLQDVQDKDGSRPGEPGYDPRTLYIPAKAWKEFTPFEKQVCLCMRHYADDCLLTVSLVLGDQAEPLRHHPILPKGQVSRAVRRRCENRASRI